MCGTLLSDINPGRSATVQASYNLVRCLGAGVGIAVLKPFVNRAGSGWTFGFYAILMMFIVPLAWILERSGVLWRERQSRDIVTHPREVTAEGKSETTKQ